MSANFVPNTWDMPLQVWNERGAGGDTVTFDLAGNVMGSAHFRISGWASGKAHRHRPCARCDDFKRSAGYSLLWPEHGEVTGVEWKPGSVVVPPCSGFISTLIPAPIPLVIWRCVGIAGVTTLSLSATTSRSRSASKKAARRSSTKTRIQRFTSSLKHAFTKRARLVAWAPWFPGAHKRKQNKAEANRRASSARPANLRLLVDRSNPDHR